MTSGMNMQKNISSKMEVVQDPNDFNAIHESSNSMTLASVMFIIFGSIFTFVGIIVIAVKLFCDHITNK